MTKPTRVRGQRNISMVNRKPSLKGWLKLNTNGACKGSTWIAGGSGVMRDSRGNWCLDFAGNIGSCQVLGAELWTVYKGLCTSRLGCWDEDSLWRLIR